MGDSSFEVSEEDRDAAQEAKGKAMGAFSKGNKLSIFCVCGIEQI